MRGCLITWNGDWALDCAVLAAVLTASAKCSVDESVAALQKVPFVQATLKTLFESLMESKVQLNLFGVTVAVELSTHATESSHSLPCVYACWDWFLVDHRWILALLSMWWRRSQPCSEGQWRL